MVSEVLDRAQSAHTRGATSTQMQEAQVKEPKQVKPLTPDTAFKSSKPKSSLSSDLSLLSKRKGRLSINSLGNKKEEGETEETLSAGEDRNTILLTELQRSWLAFSKQLEVEGQKVASRMLVAYKPTLIDEELIALEFQSKSEETAFNQIRISLLNYLRKRHHNYYLNIEYKVVVSETKMEYFTEAETFNKWRKANPAFEKLKQAFELDLL